MSDKRKFSSPHPVELMTYRNETVEIDQVLAPLISEAWKAGIGTIMCCQEVSEGVAWIEFKSVSDLLSFLNIVMRYEEDGDSLYSRAQFMKLDTNGMTLPGWEYQLNMMDIAVHDPEREVGGFIFSDATVGAYFPQSDISALHGMLKEFNAFKRCL